MSAADQPSLAEKMRQLAASGHERAADLKKLADEFDAVSDYSKGPKALLGAWARARRLWCECTGEPLV
jgi:hypothetical protein